MRNVIALLLLIGGAFNVMAAMFFSFNDMYDKATFSLVMGIWMIESLRRDDEL